MGKYLQYLWTRSIFVCISLAALLALSCSGQREEQEPAEKTAAETPAAGPRFSETVLDAPGYEGWREYLDEFLVVYCPPDSALLERVPRIARSIKQVFLENAFRLHIRVPMPIIFYLYNNTTEIEERTDCTNTCVKGNVFHYMLFTPLGEPIMIRLLQDFSISGTAYKYVYEGLVTLLNYSKINYAEEAYIDLYNEKIVSLADMIDNDRYLAVDSATRIKAAASFIQYLIDQPWNPDSVLALYKSDLKPRQALETIFGKSLPELEQGWHDFIKAKSSIKVEY